MNKLIAIFVLNIFTSSAWAIDYLNENEKCLKLSDLKRIEKKFSQLSEVTKINKPLICLDQDIKKVWFDISKALLAIEQFKNNSTIQNDKLDEFTLSPITEKNWWQYFTKRADRFVINPEFCARNPTTIAYIKAKVKGEINLCPKFFKDSLAAQIGTLMHEVRHFDGYSHVTCTRGAEEGNEGACDKRIKDGGSYAVSVQAFVALAKSKQISIQEKVVLESLAIHYVNNKFNTKPTVKVNELVYLANTKGQVYKANLKNLAKPVFVKKLKSPAKIYANDGVFTIYPLNKKEDAYRVGSNLATPIKEIGLFAKKYNSENERERDLYDGFNYAGDGFIVKNGNIFSMCKDDSDFHIASNVNLSAKRAMAFNRNDEYENYFQTENGDLYFYECDKVGKKDIIKKTTFNVSANIVDGFGTENGVNYILDDRGELMKFNLGFEVVTPTNLPLNEWISATLKKEYVIFEK